MNRIDRSRFTAQGQAAILLTLGACLALAACGGGGGGNGSSGPAPLGLVKLTVKDAFGAPVAGAAVQGPQGKINTDAQGVALVPLNTPDSSATVTLSSGSFADKTLTVSSSSGKVNETTVTLDRIAAAAGGSLSSRSGVLPGIDSGGQQLSFEIELLVVNSDSQPIENLALGDFVLRPCTPDPATARVDCLRSADASADTAYVPTQALPQSLALIPGQPARPYAAAMLLDQSGSIASTDPSGARLFSTKSFLSALGADDFALLAAFSGNPGSLLPNPPLTVYGPFRGRSAASSYFPTVDALAPLVGGSTPLYDSLDTLRHQVAGDGTLPTGMARAVLIFTDGDDNSCGTPDACRSARERSISGANQEQVRLFTIGLSKSVDVAALGELANRTGGAFLYADSAEQLLPLNGSVGKLLSLSLPTYRLRWTVQAAAGVFRSGDALLGRVQVNAGKSSFEIPFIVGVP